MSKKVADREQKPWGELERKHKLGWILLILAVAAGIITICILQGVTREHPETDGATQLPVLQLEETYQQGHDVIHLHREASPDRLAAGNPWVEPVTEQDGSEVAADLASDFVETASDENTQLIRLPVYQAREAGEKTLIREELSGADRIPGAIITEFMGEESLSGAEALQAYFLSKYGSFQGETFEKAGICSMGVDPDTGLEQFSAILYRKDEDPAAELQSYFLDHIRIDFDEKGSCSRVARERLPKEYEKIGDYPVVTMEKATQLLEECRYFTDVSGDFPGEEQIVAGELVYRNDGSRVLIPYYQFFIALQTQTDGTVTYGAYYVPAVRGEYLDNLSIWHEVEGETDAQSADEE